MSLASFEMPDEANFACYELVNNIDLSEHYWVPIGINNIFQGCFWGNGYVISGLNFDQQYVDYYKPTYKPNTTFAIDYLCGLFGGVVGGFYQQELESAQKSQIENFSIRNSGEFVIDLSSLPSVAIGSLSGFL